MGVAGTLQKTTRHKLIKKVKDERFDEEKLQHYILLIQIGSRDFQTAVLDSAEKRLIFFEDYVFNDVNSPEEHLAALTALFESHEYLKAGFWQGVKISIKNNKFVQVPAPLFDKGEVDTYLEFNAPVDFDKESCHYCRNQGTEAVTVFAAQRAMIQWLHKVYVNTSIQLVHQSAALIEGVLTSARIRTTMPLYVYVDRFKLHVLYANGGKLVYYNQFLIRQFSDYVKYIMLVISTLGLSQEITPVVLWGYIGKNSPHYQEFVKYVRNVSFGERPRHLRFGYMFDEIQEHHFYDLLSITLLPA